MNKTINFFLIIEVILFLLLSITINFNLADYQNQEVDIGSSKDKPSEEPLEIVENWTFGPPYYGPENSEDKVWPESKPIPKPNSNETQEGNETNKN